MSWNNDDVNKEIQRKSRERMNQQTERAWREQDERVQRTKAEDEAHRVRMRDLYKNIQPIQLPSSQRQSTSNNGSGSAAGSVLAGAIVLGILAVMAGGGQSVAPSSSHDSQSIVEPPPSKVVGEEPGEPIVNKSLTVPESEIAPASPAIAQPRYDQETTEQAQPRPRQRGDDSSPGAEPASQYRLWPAPPRADPPAVIEEQAVEQPQVSSQTAMPSVSQRDQALGR